MSQTQQLLEDLLRTGMDLRKAHAEAWSADDWKDFLASPEAHAVLADVDRLCEAVKAGEMARALAACRDKMNALLAGRELDTLSGDELEAYNALLDLEGLLTVGVIKSDRNELAGWLVDSALPVLSRLAQLVLPLLV